VMLWSFVLTRYHATCAGQTDRRTHTPPVAVVRSSIAERDENQSVLRLLSVESCSGTVTAPINVKIGTIPRAKFYVYLANVYIITSVIIIYLSKEVHSMQTSCCCREAARCFFTSVSSPCLPSSCILIVVNKYVERSLSLRVTSASDLPMRTIKLCSVVFY